MHTAERGERRIHYTITGEGTETVVLIPGLGGGARLFGTLPRRFQKSGYRCITFDPVGMPPSSPLEGPFVFDDAARDLLAVLDAAGVDRCHFIGTSLGGKVALATSGLAPERFETLTMLASSAIVTPRARRVYKFFELIAQELPAESFADAAAPFLFGRSFHAARPGMVDDIVRATRPDANVRALMVAQARALQDFDGVPFAKALTCRTLCLAGAEDTLTSSDEVEATAALIEQAEYLSIEGAGHTLMLESAAVYDRIEAFLVDWS